jgi:surface protein
VNNGIFPSILSSNSIDRRTVSVLPFSNTIGCIPDTINFPLANNQYEGFYNSDNYVVVVDTTMTNSLTISMTFGLQAGGVIVVDWGDNSYGGLLNAINMFRNGSFETLWICGGTSPMTVAHTYPCHGKYIITVKGITSTNLASTSLCYNASNVISVLSFGKNNNLTTAIQTSNNNLTYIPTNRPPQHDGNYGAGGGMFRLCSRLNHPNISMWNLSNNTGFGAMFFGCSLFNQSIKNVTVNTNTSCSEMFNACAALNDPSFDNWIFNGNNNASNMFVNCWSFLGNGLETWNTSGVNNMASMFNGCFSFNANVSGWNTSNVTSMNRTFQSCTSFNQDLNSWNTSNVTDMTQMFNAGIIGGVAVSVFNKPLNNWNVRKCNNFSNMFWANTNFNSSLSGWQPGLDTTGANCTSMFQSCPNFNQDLSSWNVRKVTNFTTMFNSATSFNGSLSGWAPGADTAGANCSSMFQSATNFNQDLSSWDTSKVTSTAAMFQSSSNFNQNIGSWNMGSVTNMGSMFQSSVFNNGGSPSISGWNTSNVTNMQAMFWVARNFNQPIGNWNVSKVTSFANCFLQAVSFDQDISSWNLAGINSAGGLDNFMDLKPYAGGVALSTANYDALLIGWNNNKLATANGIANWRTDLRPKFGSAKYTAGGAAATARAALVSYGWTITDGGVA